jgi:hypothetical protein
VHYKGQYFICLDVKITRYVDPLRSMKVYEGSGSIAPLASGELSATRPAGNLKMLGAKWVK